MKDRVLFCRQESEPHRVSDIKNLLDTAGKRYVKIRADLECLSGENSAIVKHIKSYKDWEYFIDNFIPDEVNYAPNSFNFIKTIKTDNTNGVLLYYSPSFNQYDTGNIFLGQCSFDDILDIEKIIKTRKQFYKDNK